MSLKLARGNLMKPALPLIALGFLSLTSPALADGARCYANADFLVIAEERMESAGTNIVVRTEGAIMPCTYAVTEGDIVIGSEDEPLWFEALEGKHLVLRRSTGPEGNLVIYDLTRPEEPVLDVPAESHPIILPQDVIFWAFDAPGTAETCPAYSENTANGLGSMVTAETTYSFIDGSLAQTGDTRCIATQ